MNDDRQSLRGTDTNSLLRLYDQAVRLSNTPQPESARRRAARAVQRIGDELRRRGTPL